MKPTITQSLVVACMMSFINFGALAASPDQKEDSIKSVALTQQDIELAFSSATSESVLLTSAEMRETKGGPTICWPSRDGSVSCVSW